MSIPNRCRKLFDKIQHSFIMQTLSKLEIECNFLNLIKGIYEKPSANTIFKDNILRTTSSNREQSKYTLSHHLH